MAYSSCELYFFPNTKEITVNLYIIDPFKGPVEEYIYNISIEELKDLVYKLAFYGIEILPIE